MASSNTDAGTMPREDLALLVAFAATTEYGFIQTVCLVGFYGAYCVVALMGFYALITKLSLRSRATWLLFLASWAVFIVTTLTVGLFTTLAFSLLRLVLIRGDAGIGMLPRIEAYRDLLWVRRVQRGIRVLIGGSGCNIVFIINDSVAVWRAMSLWSRASGKLRTSAFLNFLVLCNFGLYLASISLAYVQPDIPAIDNTSTVAIVQLAGSALGILANVCATLVFGWMALRLNLFGYAKERVGARARKAAIMLTESGLLYAVLQVARFALVIVPDSSTHLDSPLILANVVLQLGGFVLGAMYTPVVILVVTYKRSTAHIVQANRVGLRRAESASSEKRVDEDVPVLLTIQDMAPQDGFDGEHGSRNASERIRSARREWGGSDSLPTHERDSSGNAGTRLLDVDSERGREGRVDVR